MTNDSENTGLNKWDGEIKIPGYIWILLIMAALFFDGLQALATLFVVTSFFSPFITVVAWLLFYITFKLYGMDFFAKSSRFFTMSGGALVELLPVVNALPAWTATIVAMWFLGRIKKVAGGASNS